MNSDLAKDFRKFRGRFCLGDQNIDSFQRGNVTEQLAIELCGVRQNDGSSCRRNHPGGDVNLHVRAVGSPNERLALLFRDYLRANPLAVAAYGRFKQMLAAEVGALEPYTDIKDPVVDLVVAAASDWARAEDWLPHGS